MFISPVEEIAYQYWKNENLSLFFTMLGPSGQIITVLMYHAQMVKYTQYVIKQS